MPSDVERLTALLEEHGIVPDRDSEHRGGGGSWGLTHRYIYAKVAETPDFPMTVDEVRAILEGGREGGG
jgi:hypothetical protein